MEYIEESILTDQPDILQQMEQAHSVILFAEAVREIKAAFQQQK